MFCNARSSKISLGIYETREHPRTPNSFAMSRSTLIKNIPEILGLYLLELKLEKYIVSIFFLYYSKYKPNILDMFLARVDLLTVKRFGC